MFKLAKWFVVGMVVVIAASCAPATTPTPVPPTASPMPTSTPTPVPPTATLAPASVTPTYAATPIPLAVDGTWKGMSGQKQEIEFRVQEGKIVSYSLGFELPCGSYTLNGGAGTPVTGNAFELSSKSSQRTLTMSGKFNSSTAASGTFHLNGDPRPAIPCLIDVTTTWDAIKQ